jgi:hypothetical protein
VCEEILEPFVKEVTDEEKNYTYFQWDSALVHANKNSGWVLLAVFNERIINTGPSGSQDVNVCNFYH